MKSVGLLTICSSVAIALITTVTAFTGSPTSARGDGFSSERIIVTAEGNGPDVIFIPGLGSSAEVWRGEVNRLKGHYRLHLVQVAGFAGTPAHANGKPPIIDPLRDEVLAYIETQKLKQPVIIGHSMGGLLAMMIAEARPTAIGKVMVVDSLPFFGLLSNPNATVEAVAPVAARVRDQVLAQSQANYAAGQPRTMAMLVKSQGPEAQAALTASQMSDHTVVAHVLYEVWTADFRPKLAKMEKHLTVLYPYDERMGISQAMVDGIYSNAYSTAKRTKLIRVEGSFHFIQIDQPERFHELVVAFLSE